MKAGEVRRAKVILRLAAGQSYRAIVQREGCSQDFVARWKERFVKERLAGLYARHRGKIVSEGIIGQEARILKATKQAPPDGSTHWSTRKLAGHLGVSHSRVARVWARAGIQPHRLRRYMASTDPEFEEKAADVIGLYLKPPLNAAVFCVDEKSAIQALDRLDPVLPLSPGRAERHGFEYYRHGTLSLYAALDTRSGEVIGQTSARHTSAEFVAFLEDLIARQLPERAIHIICDNLSAHKTKAVCDFLVRHPKVRIHYTRPIRRGSIRSKSGSQKSNVISLPAASLRRSKIWIVKSCAISAYTIAKPIRLNGLIRMLLIASNPLCKSMKHCTSNLWKCDLEITQFCRTFLATPGPELS